MESMEIKILEVGEMDKQDFRVESSAIKLLCRVKFDA